MVEDNGGSKLEHFTRIMQAASAVSVIVGICAALFGMYSALQNARTNALATKLSGVTAVNQFIDEDTKVRGDIGKFLSAYSGDSGKEKLRELMRRYQSGEKAYESTELSELRDIGRHYERMGTYVKLWYLDFLIVYEVIPFPDDFWNETAEFRIAVRKDSWSDGRGLHDFWKNFELLRQRYIEQRAKDSDGR